MPGQDIKLAIESRAEYCSVAGKGVATVFCLVAVQGSHYFKRRAGKMGSAVNNIISYNLFCQVGC